MASKKNNSEVPASVEAAIENKMTYNPLIQALQENDKKHLFTTNVTTAFLKTGYAQFDHFFGSVINKHDATGKIIKQEPRIGQAAGTFNMLVGSSQAGKCEPISTLIPAPVSNGYIRMGDINIGTTLFAADGSFTKVTGVFNKGIKDIYKITFSDGRTNYCGLEHLWEVQEYSYGNWTTKVVSTEEIYNNITDDQGYCKFRIPNISSPVRYPKREISLDPYTFGVVLAADFVDYGDGIFRLVLDTNEIAEIIAQNNGFTYSYEPYNDDPFAVYSFFNEEKPVMIADIYDLCYKNNFRIPNNYKYNDAEIRYSIIQGIMDVSGIVTNGEKQFVTNNSLKAGLIEDVQEIIRSLGNNANIYNNKLVISHDSHFMSKIFRTYAKLSMIQDIGDRYQYIYITDVSYDRKEEAKCLMVDNTRHLYVTNQFILTHNTTFAIQVGANIIRQYPQANLIHFDCEERLDITRCENITNLPAEFFRNGRYLIKTGAVGLDIIQEMVVKTYVTKMRMKDQLMVDSGITDEFDEPVKILQPTFIIIDSITTVLSETFNPENNKESADAEKMRSNTEGARDAKTLKGFFKDVLPLCKEADIIIYAINHININMSMNAFVPVAKQQNYLKQDESIPGGKTMLYYPFNIIKLTAKTSDSFDEEADGFSGHIVMVEPLKCSSNQSGNNSKGVSFELVFSHKYGFDPLRSLIMYGRDRGLIEGNRNRLKFKGEDYTFAWKEIDTEKKTKPIWKDIQKYIIPDLDQYLPYTEVGTFSFDEESLNY